MGVLKEFTQAQISAVMLTQFQFGIQLYQMPPVSPFHSPIAAAVKQHPLLAETTQADEKQREIYATPNEKQCKGRLYLSSLLGTNQIPFEARPACRPPGCHPLDGFSKSSSSDTGSSSRLITSSSAGTFARTAPSPPSMLLCSDRTLLPSRATPG